MSKASHHEARSIVRGFQWTYASVALQGFLKLAALMTLARLLTPRDFGLLSFALLCTNFVERIGQGGIGPAVVQLQDASKEAIATAWWMSVGLGILSAIIVGGFAGQVAIFFGEPQLAGIVRVLSFGCLLEALVAIPEALLQRELRCREIMIADNLAYFVSMLGVCCVLAFSGWGVWSLVIAHVGLKFLRLLLLAWVAPECPWRPVSWSQVRYFTRMGLGFSLGRLLNFFSLQGDNFIVGRLLGTDALGMYNRAYQLMTLPAMYVGQVFERVMFPAMARKQMDKQRLCKEFLLALEVLTLIALPTGVVMFILAEEIVLVGFGERWRSVIPVVSVLAFGVFFRTAYKCSDTVVRSVGAVYRYAGRQALYAVLVLCGALVGAVVDGVTGVACGVVVAVACNYLSMTRLSIRLVGISLADVLRAHLVGLWASIWVGVALLSSIAVVRACSHHPFVVLLEAGVIGAVAWIVSLTIPLAYAQSGVMYHIRRYIRSHYAGTLGLARPRTR